MPVELSLALLSLVLGVFGKMKILHFLPNTPKFILQILLLMMLKSLGFSFSQAEQLMITESQFYFANISATKARIIM